MVKAKPYYVATSIPYANAAPHIGHTLEFIQADVLARYHRQLGRDVFFSTGTDEHGQKVLNKAQELKLSPQTYVDKVSAEFKTLLQELNISNTEFIRTTDAEHIHRVGLLWKALSKDIYRGQYKGAYDTKQEEFLTREQARQIALSDPTRAKLLTDIEEDNYFFKLSNYGSHVREAIESGRIRVIPKGRKNEILHLIKDGLEDISISRPKTKMPWGINVPGDPHQTIYVWFEALMNYLTILQYPEGRDYQTYWPCDVHVIGKDILRFHAAIWPAMLMSLGLELPKVIFVHGFVTINGAVMSKTVGNVVSPMEMVSTYGSDATRYYLLNHIPSQEDGDFSWAKMEEAYNGELGNELGNLVQRVAKMVDLYQAGKIGDIPESIHDTADVVEAMEDYRFDKALTEIWTLIRGLNQYIDEQKPWKIAKEQDREHLREVLAYLVSSLLQMADLLEPFLPDTSAKIIRIFGSGEVQPLTTSLFPRINQQG